MVRRRTRGPRPTVPSVEPSSTTSHSTVSKPSSSRGRSASVAGSVASSFRHGIWITSFIARQRVLPPIGAAPCVDSKRHEASPRPHGRAPRPSPAGSLLLRGRAAALRHPRLDARVLRRPRLDHVGHRRLRPRARSSSCPPCCSRSRCSRASSHPRAGDLAPRRVRRGPPRARRHAGAQADRLAPGERGRRGRAPPRRRRPRSRTCAAPELRSVLTILAPAPLLFLALFLINSPLDKLSLTSRRAGEPAAGDLGPTPVVLVVFDELPLASLARRRAGGRPPAPAPLRRPRGRLDALSQRDDGARAHDRGRARRS